MNYKTSILNSLLYDYLLRIGQGRTPSFGESGPEVTEADSRFLLDKMSRQLATNARIVYLAVAMLVVLFLLGIYFVIRYVDQPNMLAAVIGGNMFSLLVIVVWLRKLWLEKSSMDSLYLIVSALSPAEAAKIIVAFHFAAMKSAIPTLTGELRGSRKTL